MRANDIMQQQQQHQYPLYNPLHGGGLFQPQQQQHHHHHLANLGTGAGMDMDLAPTMSSYSIGPTSHAHSRPRPSSGHPLHHATRLVQQQQQQQQQQLSGLARTQVVSQALPPSRLSHHVSSTPLAPDSSLHNFGTSSNTRDNVSDVVDVVSVHDDAPLAVAVPGDRLDHTHGMNDSIVHHLSPTSQQRYRSSSAAFFGHPRADYYQDGTSIAADAVGPGHGAALPDDSTLSGPHLSVAMETTCVRDTPRAPPARVTGHGRVIVNASSPVVAHHLRSPPPSSHPRELQLHDHHHQHAQQQLYHGPHHRHHHDGMHAHAYQEQDGAITRGERYSAYNHIRPSSTGSSSSSGSHVHDRYIDSAIAPSFDSPASPHNLHPRPTTHVYGTSPIPTSSTSTFPITASITMPATLAPSSSSSSSSLSPSDSNETPRRPCSTSSGGGGAYTSGGNEAISLP